MFASGFVTFFFVALVAVNVVGYPVPEPIRVPLLSIIWGCTENAYGFVSVLWLRLLSGAAAWPPLNPYRLMSTVTMFVCDI
jgi:hypothetical protein